MLAGEFTFMIGDEVTVGGPGTCAFMPRDVPHAWKNTGSETGRVLFLYTPAAAGSLIEELARAPLGRRRTHRVLRAPPLGGPRPKPALTASVLISEVPGILGLHRESA